MYCIHDENGGTCLTLLEFVSKFVHVVDRVLTYGKTD